MTAARGGATGTDPLVRVPVEVMGTVVSLTLRAPGLAPAQVWAAVADARAVLHRSDAVFSTWKAHSPLSRLRRGEIGLADAPPEVAEVLALCADARRFSHGWYDPWALPGGVDPTGMVKGWAARQALGALARSGVAAAMVNAGGDVACFGSYLPAGEVGRGLPWRIGIRHPWVPDGLAAVVEAGEGSAGVAAVATSGTYERGAHLFDPRSRHLGAHSVSATVTGPDLALADALATGLAVAGEEGLAAVASVPGYQGYVIGAGGAEAATERFPFAA